MLLVFPHVSQSIVFCYVNKENGVCETYKTILDTWKIGETRIFAVTLCRYQNL